MTIKSRSARSARGPLEFARPLAPRARLVHATRVARDGSKLRAEPDPHHGPAPELRGGDTIAADRNVALDDVRFAAHYGLKSDIALGPKTCTSTDMPLILQFQRR